MNNIFRISGVVLLILSIIFIHSCKKKEEVPVITTTAVSNITATTATSGGNITNEGSSTVISRGVCWSIGTTPTIADSKTTDGAGAGSFTSSIINLFGGTTYFVRAYATNTTGIGYGMALSFKTTGQPPSAPIVTTQDVTSIQTSSATLNGTVNAMYYSTTVTFEYGETTGYGSTITATQSPVTGNTNTNLSANITGLTVGTTYHYRIKAVNSLGTTYGVDMIFTTGVAVGDFYNGGYIFYVDASNQHGLVVTPNDQSDGVKWNNGSFITTNASGYVVGSGQPNTNSIITAQGGGNYAAKICDYLVLNGYDDWFLPSYGEIKLMRKIYDLRIGNLKAVFYWSSTEYSGNLKSWALSVSPSDIVGEAARTKDALLNVRAVRAF